MTIKEMSTLAYQNAKAHGFHDGETVGDVSIERTAMFVANLHGEASELWESARVGKLGDPCGKSGCPLTCLEEELADIIIRTMDTAESFGIDLEKAIILKHSYNIDRPHMHGKKA